MNICNRELCTGCGACQTICPKNAIKLSLDSATGNLYPIVDSQVCVNCSLCKRVCPNNHPVPLFPVQEVQAAYSSDSEVWNNAASGGIATELYKLALNNEWFTMATYFDREEGVVFREVKDFNDISWACSSKYVFSNMITDNVYIKYKKALQDGITSVFIGLPCQCAALKNYLLLSACDISNLYFISLICHGVPSWEFLNQHLRSIEKNSGLLISSIRFRDKKNDFYFTAFSKDKMVCSVDMHKKETYANPFINNLIFRDNCYKCLYACPDRCSDLTIGDYDGIDLEPTYKNRNKQVSCVLISTDKGRQLFNKISSQLWMEQRPIDEPMKYNGQLNHPSIPNPKRKKFLNLYCRTTDYEYSILKSFGNEVKYEWKVRGCIVLMKQYIINHLNFIYRIYRKVKYR